MLRKKFLGHFPENFKIRPSELSHVGRQNFVISDTARTNFRYFALRANVIISPKMATFCNLTLRTKRAHNVNLRYTQNDNILLLCAVRGVRNNCNFVRELNHFVSLPVREASNNCYFALCGKRTKTLILR